MSEKYAKLFEPIKIGGVEIKNRFFMSPMGNFGYVDEQGALTDAAVDFYVERAKGGMGLIFTGFCIADEGIEDAETPSIMVIRKNSLIFVQKASVLTEKVHAYGSKIFLQLTAGFGRAAKVVKVNKKIAVSDTENMYDASIKHKAMTTEEVKAMIQSFGEAARLAKKCGFDGVEIHALHEGYLLDQFTMEYFNKRTDEYGGSFENRYRVACEIVQTIKKACGNDFPVTLRYSVKHFMKSLREGILPEEADSVEEMGRDVPEGLKAAKLLQEAGYDAFDSDVGCYEAHYWSHPNIFLRDGMYLDLSAKLAEAVDVPVLVAGRMDNPDFALDAVESGKCDMIGLGRPALADPYLVDKIKFDETERIRHCISCNYGCLVNIFNKSTIRCAINPQCYMEKSNGLNPVAQKKKVAVIGGGPAGMQAALTSAMRGHDVSLYEKKGKLGGNLHNAGAILSKHHIGELVEWFKTELDHHGVDITLNSEINAEMINGLDADVLFVATGSKARSFKIPGSDQDNVFLAHETYTKPEIVGDNVTIIGAGQIGMETAIWLARMGKNVSVVEFTDTIMGGSEVTPHGDIDMVESYIKFYHIDMNMNTKVTAIDGSTVKIEKVETGDASTIEADTILIAVGYESVNGLYSSIKDACTIKKMHHIGDSNRVANIYYAVHDAYELANNI